MPAQPVFLPGESHEQRLSRLQCMGCRVDHDWATNCLLFTHFSNQYRHTFTLAKHRDSQGPRHFCGPSDPPFSWLLHQDCGCVVLFTLKGPASRHVLHWEFGHRKAGDGESKVILVLTPPPQSRGSGDGPGEGGFGFAIQHLLSSTLSCARLFSEVSWADTLCWSGTFALSPGFSHDFFSEGPRLGVRGVGWAGGQFYIGRQWWTGFVEGAVGDRVDQEKRKWE